MDYSSTILPKKIEYEDFENLLDMVNPENFNNYEYCTTLSQITLLNSFFH